MLVLSKGGHSRDTGGGECLASFTGLSGDKRPAATSPDARSKMKAKLKEAEGCKQPKTEKNRKKRGGDLQI